MKLFQPTRELHASELNGPVMKGLLARSRVIWALLMTVVTAAPSTEAATQKIFLDFDSFTDIFTMPPEHVYTPAERAEILSNLEEDYAPFDFSFHLAPPAAPFSTVFFNAGPTGGESDEIDFRNLNLSTMAILNVNGKPFPMGGTSEEVVALSSTIAAHEIGHFVGLRHGDSFGPIGSGIHAPKPGPMPYSPDYPGPAMASETNGHTMSDPASTGQTPEEFVMDTHFGVREAIKLEFIETGSVEAETMSAHGTLATAQPITLTPLPVPNTTKPGDKHFGMVLLVDAVTVTGSLSATGEFDVYSFSGGAGELFNFEVMSIHLTRFMGDDKINPEIAIYDSSGALVPYYSAPFGAFNDDDFELFPSVSDSDSILIDLVLPADDTYFVAVTAVDPADTGSYELFAYRFAAVPEPSGLALCLAALSLAARRGRRQSRTARPDDQLRLPSSPIPPSASSTAVPGSGISLNW